MATEIAGTGGIADGQVAELEGLHDLDPDQVAGDAVKKRLGSGSGSPSGWVCLVVVAGRSWRRCCR